MKVLNPPEWFLYIYIYIYICISVVFADDDKIENFMNIYAKLDPKRDHKIDVWAIRGSTCEVLGGFWRSPIFVEFSISKKFSKKRYLASEGLQKAILGDHGPWVGG